MFRHLGVLVVIPAMLLAGCMSASQHAADVQGGLEGDKLSVGTVQREIRVGMSGAEVAQVLGSPNIVTTDEQRREVWVYDRISTTHAYSTSQGGVGALILGAGSSVFGLGSASTSANAGASGTSQKTLTVIIRFDEQHLVRDFDYHTSRF